MIRKLVPVALVVAGCLAAWLVQTGGGSIRVQDVRFAGASGNIMSGLLYIPAEATPESPQPAILAVHGYINSRETQSGFAIEFARRGFVVLALDQTGHGYSDPPAFAHGFGGPDGLRYLRSLEFVDPSRIGLEGHSMGGWAVQMAAAANPEAYESMVLLGSSTGTFGAPPGTPTHPRNLLVVFSRFDEFSGLMWGADVPADIVGTGKLRTLFDTDDVVEVGRLYGDIGEGTARKLLMPAVTHPGDHLSTEAIGAAADWFAQTLGAPVPVDSQRWYLKELATLIALVGLAWLVFPILDRLLRAEYFGAICRELPRPEQAGRRRWLLRAVVVCLVPAVTFFPLQMAANVVLPPTPVFAQQITNGVLLWAWGTALVNLALFWFWYRRQRPGFARWGLRPERGIIFRSAVLAGIVFACGLAIVALAEYVLNVDFRFWVVALKSPSAMQLGLIAIYLPLFTVFFLVLSLTFHPQMRRSMGLRRAMWVNGAILSAGFVLLLGLQYLPLLTGGTLLIASQPLLTIVAFQFVPLLFFVGLLSTFTWERTGCIYPGAFLSASLVTWYIVAGTATQAVPFWFH